MATKGLIMRIAGQLQVIESVSKGLHSGCSFLDGHEQAYIVYGLLYLNSSIRPRRV
jgi:hypothetical protein